MDLRLDDKVVFVGGSSRGIGRAIAHAFLTEGARVVLTGRRPESLTHTETELTGEFQKQRVLACQGDLTQPDTIERALATTCEHWGNIDCVVANIGSGSAKSGWQLAQPDWDSVFASNLWSGTRLVEAALPIMMKAGTGSIVFIASIVGLESINAPLSYSAAKAALISYSKNLAREVASYGIRVNSVAPGNVLFAGGSWERKLAARPADVQRYLETEVPLRRFGSPQEIADVVIFLASQRAAFITGTCVVVDGGQTRRI